MHYLPHSLDLGPCDFTYFQGVKMLFGENTMPEALLSALVGMSPTYTNRRVFKCIPNLVCDCMSFPTVPGCPKLTSLVNVSLKFQTLISQICHYFLFRKCEKLLQCKSFSHFFSKNISEFGYRVIKHLTS